MRLLIAIAGAIAATATQRLLEPKDAETRRPIIVSALSPAAPPAPPAPAAPPAAAPEHHGQLAKLEESIHVHEQSLEALSKQLEEGLAQKKRLIVAQKLLEAIIHLKKAERLLHDLDARVEHAKANIKRFGEQADEITEAIKSSEVAHKKELSDLNAKLDALRGGLGDQEKALAELVNKRGRISITVAKWKDHVSTLHDVHETLAAPTDVHHGHRHHQYDDVTDFPEPPSTSGVLGELGIVSAVDPTLIAADVAKRTFAEFGKPRFSLRGATEDDDKTKKDKKDKKDDEKDGDNDGDDTPSDDDGVPNAVGGATGPGGAL